MNNPRLCSDQCRWYGTCENTGSKSCYGLSVPEEESEEFEDKLERMTY